MANVVSCDSQAGTRSERPVVFVETYGCSFNVSDGEVMTGLLERGGYRIAAGADGADVVVLNSCTVKDRTYLDLRKRMLALNGREHPAVVLAGCVPRVYSQSREFAGYAQIGPENLASIVEVVDSALAGEPLVRTGKTDEDRLALPHRRRNPAVEIIPISRGCLGSCTFCQTVLARGRLKSFPEEQILERIRAAVSEGVNQVWLTSQDCGAYGLDCGTNLPSLMHKVAALPGKFKVRVGMANPDLLKLYLEKLVEALDHPRFYKFAHIPVQAGSDKVLRDMERLYTADDFRRICDALRSRMPEITIATDVIVGFPTETEDDFLETLSLMEETAVPVINRSKFSPRPGTRAARYRGLHSAVIAARSRRLADAARTIARAGNSRGVGITETVIIEEFPQPGVALARTVNYQPVILPDATARSHGDVLEVTIDAVENYHLVGRMADSRQPVV